MQDLINQYREQLALLSARRERLAVQKQRMRGKEYFQALRRLDLLEQECLEIACALSWMVKEYGDGRPAGEAVRTGRPHRQQADFA